MNSSRSQPAYPIVRWSFHPPFWTTSEMAGNEQTTSMEDDLNARLMAANWQNVFYINCRSARLAQNKFGKSEDNLRKSPNLKFNCLINSVTDKPTLATTKGGPLPPNA